jgi:hypothetical protein
MDAGLLLWDQGPRCRDGETSITFDHGAAHVARSSEASSGHFHIEAVLDLGHDDIDAGHDGDSGQVFWFAPDVAQVPDPEFKFSRANLNPPADTKRWALLVDWCRPAEFSPVCPPCFLKGTVPSRRKTGLARMKDVQGPPLPERHLTALTRFLTNAATHHPPSLPPLLLPPGLVSGRTGNDSERAAWEDGWMWEGGGGQRSGLHSNA